VLEYIYEVLSVEIKKRRDLTIDQAGSTKDSSQEYWLIRLGPSRKIPHPIAVKNIRKFIIFHTSANDIKASKSWHELPQRYSSLVQK
jgi:hypothetical protein